MPKKNFDDFLFDLIKTEPTFKEVKPANPKASQCDIATSNFLKIREFYIKNGRLPSIDGGIIERKLANNLIAFRGRLKDKVCHLDDLGILKQDTSSKNEQIPQSIEDLINSDTDKIFEDMDLSIFQITHVTCNPSAKKNMPDEIASKRPCQDFNKFANIFKEIKERINSGSVKIERFSSESQVSTKRFYILKGIICYVAEIIDNREQEVALNAIERDNPRFRVIYDNETESNILKRSLARALYKDPNGRMIIPSAEETQILEPYTESGSVYILSSYTTSPALREMKNKKMLHKIGFTTQPLEQRIKNAANDPTYLEAPVDVVANIHCVNIDPRKFERLIHNFLSKQKLNITLFTKKGKAYKPNEWYNVDLDTAVGVAKHIIDGTISDYRMDNTTNMLKKIND